jgi:hypothetical protein
MKKREAPGEQVSNAGSWFSGTESASFRSWYQIFLVIDSPGGLYVAVSNSWVTSLIDSISWVSILLSEQCVSTIVNYRKAGRLTMLQPT